MEGTRRSAQVVSGFLTPLKAVTSSSYKHLLSAASLKKKLPFALGFCPRVAQQMFRRIRPRPAPERARTQNKSPIVAGEGLVYQPDRR